MEAEPAKATAVPLPGAGQAEFVQNLGQWPAPVRFAAALHGGRLFAESTGLTYVLAAAPAPGQPGELHAGTSLVPAAAHAYRVAFAGAAAEPAVAGQLPTGVRNSYFTGNDPASWAGGAAGFGRLHYAGLYAGIDLDLYENQGTQLEYTFTVQPGGQPAAIRLRYAGLSSLRLDSAGQLRLGLPGGIVTEQAPVAWQLGEAGQRQPVACAWRVAGFDASFELGRYDPARPVVIDPVVLFASFTGSRADNWGHTATYDSQGDFYSASTVFDYGYPASPGAYNTGFSGSVDVALIKYHPQATGPAARVWATYLGGSQTDAPHRLAVTTQGEVVVLGSTASANFPTTDGAFDRRFHGGPAIKPDGIAFATGADLFVARLAAGGDQLLASTYLGGNRTDGFASLRASPTSALLEPYVDTGNGFSGGLQVDRAGEVYVAATTASADFASGAPAGPAFGGGTTDAVVVRLAADLRTVRWRQLVGGAADDAAYDLVLDPSGTAVYACGGTYSADFRTTPGAFAPATTGKTDGFVVRLAAADGRVAAACRLGTAGHDQALLLGLDSGGNVVVTGLSQGEFPVSPGCYGLPGGNFLAQLDADLRRVQYSTTLGGYDNGAGPLVPVALGLDACDQLYLALIGRTMAYPVSPNTPAASTRNFYALRLSAEARSLDYATRLPGDHVHGRSRFDGAGRLYLAVCGDCRNDRTFAVPAGVTTYASQNGARDCNDASVLADLSATAAGQAPFSTVCVGAEPLALGGSPAGGSWAGPGVSGSPTTGYFFTPTLALVGPQQLTYQPPAGSPACAGPLSRQLTVALPTAISFPALDGPFCAGTSVSQSIPLQAQPAGGYFSGPGVQFGNSTSAYLYLSGLGPGTYTITYTLPGTDGRCGSASQLVTVAGTRLATSPDTTLCGAPFRAFQLRAQPAGGTWSGSGVTASGWFDPARVAAFTTGQQGGLITVTYAYAGPDGCRSARTVGITKIPEPIASQLLPAPVCRLAPALAGYAPFTLRLPPPPGTGGIYRQLNWDFGDGARQDDSYFLDSLHTYTQPGTYAPVLTISYGYTGTCTRTIRYAPFTVGDALLPPNIITPNADGLNDTFVQQYFCEPPQLRVFSRWGQPVYRQAAYDNSWGGQGLPDGIYYYLLTDAANQRPAVKGWLEIVR